MNNTIHKASKIKFDQPTEFIVLLAKRWYGKTIMATNIIVNLIEHYDYSNIYLFSDTATFNGSYDNYVKKKNIFESDQIDKIVSRIFKHQAQKKSKDRKNVLLIFDDVNLSQISKEVAKLSSQGRHYNIGVILSVQYSKIFVSGIIRNNVDKWFVGEINKKPLEEVFESWCTIFDTYKEFYSFFRQNVKKPVFIMYDSREGETNNRLTLYQADILKDVKII
jgi:hypothetical protein